MTRNYRRKTDSLPTCMNCGSVLYGAYCSQCGQRATEPITFPRLFQQAREHVRDFDFLWLRTAAALSTDPGRMVRRYLRGRRRPFVGPLPYILGTSTVLALTVLLGLDLDRLSALTPWAMQTGTAQTAVIAAGIYGGILVTLVVAWLQQTLHKDAGHALLETWVFGLYVFGHLALFQTVFALLGAFNSFVGLLALAVAIVLVLAFALAGFYRQAVVRALPAALILASTYIAGVFVVSALARLVLS